MASDTTGSNEGWRVDTVDLFVLQGRRVLRRRRLQPDATATITGNTVTPHSYGYCYSDRQQLQLRLYL